MSKLELPKAGSGNRIGACLFLPRMQICHVAEQLWVPRVQILALVSEKSRKVIFTQWQLLEYLSTTAPAFDYTSSYQWKKHECGGIKYLMYSHFVLYVASHSSAKLRLQLLADASSQQVYSSLQSSAASPSVSYFLGRYAPGILQAEIVGTLIYRSESPVVSCRDSFPA